MAEEPFRFLDLPPEIRNEIYTLLLPKGRQVRIWKNRRFRNARVYSGTPMTQLARLLRTNHQIHQEVAPMVYGALIFKFYVSGGVLRWLRTIGSMNQHIRHVHLEGWTVTNIRSALHQLKRARFLHTFELGNEIQLQSAAGVAETLKPFIKALQNSKDADQAPDDVLKVIRAMPNPYVAENFKAQEEKDAEEYEMAVRAELRKLLD